MAPEFEISKEETLNIKKWGKEQVKQGKGDNLFDRYGIDHIKMVFIIEGEPLIVSNTDVDIDQERSRERGTSFRNIVVGSEKIIEELKSAGLIQPESSPIAL